MKPVLGLWSAHCAVYLVTFMLFVTERISKTDMYAITTMTSVVTAVIFSAWLFSEQAKVLKANKCLADLAPHVRNVGTVINLSPSRLYEEEKRKIDEEFALMSEISQYAGTD